MHPGGLSQPAGKLHKTERQPSSSTRGYWIPKPCKPEAENPEEKPKCQLSVGLIDLKPPNLGGRITTPAAASWTTTPSVFLLTATTTSYHYFGHLHSATVTTTMVLHRSGLMVLEWLYSNSPSRCQAPPESALLFSLGSDPCISSVQRARYALWLSTQFQRAVALPPVAGERELGRSARAPLEGGCRWLPVRPWPSRPQKQSASPCLGPPSGPRPSTLSTLKSPARGGVPKGQKEDLSCFHSAPIWT